MSLVTDAAMHAVERGARHRDRLRVYGPLALLAVVAALLSWWSSHAVFPAFSWNRDEPVYLWQVQTLKAGMFATTDGGAPEFFHPWLSAARDGTVFSQYTLGWPLILLAGDVVFGSAAAGMAFGASLAVVGTFAFARALLRDDASALMAAGLMTISPIIIVQGGVYLGYLFTLGVGLGFAAALITGVRDHNRARLLGAGLLLGYVFLTRPFDAVLWGAAIGLPVIFARGQSRGAVLRDFVWCALGALPLVIITLAYNQRMTGSALTFPVTVKDSLDTYGFGVRRIMPEFGEIDYGVVTAVKGTLKNGFYLLLFVAGGVLALPVALFGLWRLRRDSIAPVLGALFVAFPAGYFFFWGTNVSSLTSRISGPIYFVPMYAPVCVLVGIVFLEVARRRRTAGVLFAAVVLVSGLPFAINRIETNHRISEAQQPWTRASAAVRAIDRDSLVFVADSGPYLMFLNPYSANDPELDGHVLWAVDRAGENIDLIEASRGRDAYRMQPSFRGDELGPDEHPKVPEISLVPLEIVTGESLVLHATVENPSDEPVVVVTMWIDGQVVQRTLAEDSRRGARHEFTWTLTRTDDGDTASALPLPHGTFTLGVGYGPTTQVAAAPVVRQVIPYRSALDVVDVLLPTRAERLADIGGPKLRWRPTFQLPEITISIEPT
jgi:hypothetical protein